MNKPLTACDMGLRCLRTKILRWEGAANGERGSHTPVRIHDTDGCLVAIGKCPDEFGGALKVEKVLIDQDV